MQEMPSESPLCVPVCSGLARDLRRAVERAATFADIIELRLDCLSGRELDHALESLEALHASQIKPFIITLRPAEQGGRREIDSLNRIAFWLDRLNKERPCFEFADIELDVARVLMEKKGLDWKRIICSHHDFAAAHFDPVSLYEEMKEVPAHLLKIAFRALDATDCLAVFQLLERAQSDGRNLIALAMGEAGIVTRILGPARGSFLTYGALDESHATAPGQPTALELRDLYRVHRITGKTTITGLLGGAVAHSLSPHIQNAAFAEGALDAVYVPFMVKDVGAFVRRMVHPRSREICWEMRGLSVTAPHKVGVMEHLDWIEPAAREIGAVNTIVVEAEELRGYNTDAQAFLSTLEQRVGSLSGKEVALIGAGGAARAALWSLRKVNAEVTIFARDAGRAASLGQALGARAETLAGALFHDFDIVVNATPLGTRGTSEMETPATADQLRGARLAYDLVYNPRETLFLREARAAGCETLTGLEMLVAQAAEQFRLWTGREAPVHVMRDAAGRAMEAKTL
jgi:3-dehydroquinate dehydratase / shikimate dehydrogenase